MKKIISHLLAGCLALMAMSALSPLRAQCSLENKAFKAGENLEYQLYFNWKFIWIKAGTANLNISQKKYDGKDALRCHLITTGTKRTDKFFMMRDTLVSYIRPDLVPLYYRKGALEGKRYYVDEVWYKYPHGRNELRMRYRNSRGMVSDTTCMADACVYDMVSMLMRARSFDPAQFQKGQHLKFYMAEHRKVKEGTLIYRGKKNFTMEETGTEYRCLVFSFVDYEGKKEKEVVTFYVTDDDNHLPVRLDLFLRFGVAKAFLRKAENVRNPQNAIIH
ncbi:MAG: DUF3108 domain-containing protein [Bacteroidaceae bacterium]|nr:DUF3108 domain-containing protein [Bacteroidaceae bacterium]